MGYQDPVFRFEMARAMRAERDAVRARQDGILDALLQIADDDHLPGSARLLLENDPHGNRVDDWDALVCCVSRLCGDRYSRARDRAPGDGSCFRSVNSSHSLEVGRPVLGQPPPTYFWRIGLPQPWVGRELIEEEGTATELLLLTIPPTWPIHAGPGLLHALYRQEAHDFSRGRNAVDMLISTHGLFPRTPC